MTIACVSSADELVALWTAAGNGTDSIGDLDGQIHGNVDFAGGCGGQTCLSIASSELCKPSYSSITCQAILPGDPTEHQTANQFGSRDKSIRRPRFVETGGDDTGTEPSVDERKRDELLKKGHEGRRRNNRFVSNP